MSNNPKLATEQQVKDVSDTFTEIINHQGKQIKALESGVIDAIEPSSLAPTKRGEYKVTKVGVYINFKDANGQPISVTEEDYSSGNVSIIFNGNNSRMLIVPITFEGEVKEGETRGVNGNEVFKFLSGIIDYTPPLILTNKKYINSGGGLIDTENTECNATEDFIPLNNCSKIVYKGIFGNSGTRIALYKDKSAPSKIITYPESNEPLTSLEITRPIDAKYIRISHYGQTVPALKLINYVVDKDLQIIDFKIIGKPTYKNGLIFKSKIKWNDGSLGNVTYGDYSTIENTYTSFIATHEVSGKTIIQPQVVFDTLGNIIEYPEFLIK
ncbi:hypothetical protein HMPREF9714_03348 [Myroides odoratimimus CCUG 12901]|uniref:hypothetical protein n=1 Tax=Myroides odoratimimus TaxID=76832 RepID=UPI0002461154|nr:hypothetical protein [Myroides odoratimimus]EHO05410.1 hypothetical protein HMPREF9714_03348 [Myroides odoratimimus CCUG 12901]